jgi:fructokinase
MGVGIGPPTRGVEACPPDLAIFPRRDRYGPLVIVVGGEALYDLVARDDGTIDAHPGGGPFNTARTIGRLEQPVAFLGRLSTDRFGESHARILAEDGVDLSGTPRSDDPTTLALAEIGAAGHARYHFYASGTAAIGLQLDDARAALHRRVDILHVGSLGLVYEPIAGVLADAVEALHPTALIALDPNCRPAAIDDEGAYRARLRRIVRRTHVLKLSEDDLAWLAPDQPLLELGPSVVLLTRGEAGATVMSPGRETDIAAPEVDVVDTIGAGDAFGGGFLAWWHAHGLGREQLADHDLLLEAARYAARVAAITCTRAGAVPPRVREIDV